VFNGEGIRMGVFDLLGRELEVEMMGCVIFESANPQPWSTAHHH